MNITIPANWQVDLGLVALRSGPKPEFGQPGMQARSKAGVPKWTVEVRSRSLGETFRVTGHQSGRAGRHGVRSHRVRRARAGRDQHGQLLVGGQRRRPVGRRRSQVKPLSEASPEVGRGLMAHRDPVDERIEWVQIPLAADEFEQAVREAVLDHVRQYLIRLRAEWLAGQTGQSPTSAECGIRRDKVEATRWVEGVLRLINRRVD